MGCPQGRGRPGLPGVLFTAGDGLCGACEDVHLCTWCRLGCLAVLCGHGYQHALEHSSLPVTLPLAPGERSPLPKASAMPGPLDGSQELLVWGSVRAPG